MSLESDKIISDKIKELTNVHRIVTNGLNWLNDVEVKVAYIEPVNEVIGFLKGFQASLAQQKQVLEATLPKAEEPKAVEATVVA